MTTISSIPKANRGFTLMDTIVAMGVTVAIMGALMTGVISTTKSLNAAMDYSVTQGDQLRVVDYVSRDLRSATSVTTPAGNGSTLTLANLTLDGQAFTSLTLSASSTPWLQISLTPVYSGSKTALWTAVTPTCSDATKTVTYGGTSSTIYYFLYGSAFFRLEDNGTTKKGISIATNVKDFVVSPVDATSSVSYSIKFSPLFQNPSSQESKDATQVYTKVYLRNAAARN